MSCVQFDTLEDLWQLLIWVFVWGAIYGFLNRFWSASYYYFIKSKVFLPPGWLYLMLNVVVVFGSAYATWRLWSCENWDWSPIRLFISLIFIIAYSLYNPILHRTKSFLGTSIFMVVIVLLAAAMIVFSFTGGSGVADTFAGIIFIAIFVYCVYLLFMNFLLWRNERLIDDYKEYQKALGKQTKEKQAVQQEEIEKQGPLFDSTPDDLEKSGQIKSIYEVNRSEFLRSRNVSSQYNKGYSRINNNNNNNPNNSYTSNSSQNTNLVNRTNINNENINKQDLQNDKFLLPFD